MSVELESSDDAILEKTLFGRNRALKVMGAALFGLALRVAAPQIARATNTDPPYPCLVLPQCHCCSGTTCCEAGCNWPGGDHTHCSTGGQCWYTCVTGGSVYQCCDWHTLEGTSHACICSELTQITC